MSDTVDKDELIRRALARGELLWEVLAQAKIPLSLARKLETSTFDKLEDVEKLIVVKTSNIYHKGLAAMEAAMEVATTQAIKAEGAEGISRATEQTEAPTTTPENPGGEDTTDVPPPSSHATDSHAE